VRRLLSACPPRRPSGVVASPAAVAPLAALREWLTAAGDAPAARLCAHYLDHSPLHAAEVLPGPTGEQNTYELRPRGRVLCRAETRLGALAQLAAALATGNIASFVKNGVTATLFSQLPASVKTRVRLVADESQHLFSMTDDFTAALFEGESPTAAAWARTIADRDGPIVTPQCLTPGDTVAGAHYALEWLVTERSISVNTAAAGGNASLMTIG
jgi:RHH-type proline utilization regulon transcriptional repressor/proline dehydrogenase/delta 1-pyrroline-5-carboxylate dehydrogenase